MTQAQLLKYRAEWAKAWKALRAAGRAELDQETTRKRWHVLIGAVYRRGREAGQAKSSTVLTNREFDAFLKRCAATHSPASLEKQLALDAQPEIRALTACAPLLDELGMEEGRRSAYIAGIYANVQRKRAEKNERVWQLHEMPDDDLQIVLIALTHTVEHKLGIEHNHPRSGRGLRSREDHRVGSRRRQSGNPASESGNQVTRYEADPAYVPPEDQPF